MNRYDWIIWAFKLFLSSDVIKETRLMVERLENNANPGAKKRDFVIETLKPMLGNTSIFILRALINIILAQLRKND